MEEEYDLVVIGGGVYGLPVPKTYLEINPGARVLLLDAGQSVGGTWSAERLYEGLRTNNQVGSLEYADFPMDFDTYGIKPGSHVPGEALHEYLNAYVDHYGFRDRIRLCAVVQSAELLENGTWLIRYNWKTAHKDMKKMKLTAKKLVLATGTTSKPHMPSVPGMDTFEGSLFHSAELGSHAEDLTVAKNVVILGGSKSSADAVYMNASQGKHVDWVIRASGRGPAWLSSPYVSPAKFLFEKLATTRFVSFTSPALDLDAYPTIRTFFHNTRLGRALLRGFFGVINNDMRTLGKYNEHPETKKLTPRSNVYWWGTTVGLFNYPTDLFEFVRQGLVHVHIADPVSISPYAVQLSDGTEILADVFICATGYEQTPTINILPESIAAEMGVSNALPDNEIVKAADEEILRRFPELKDQPPAGLNGLREREQTSSTLYRGIIPPSFLASHNLAYCGMAVSLRGFLTAQITAPWIAAFLDERLTTPLPSQAEAEWQAMLQNRFWRWRAPNGLGPKSPDMVSETMPFVDTLLRDLGLPTARKSSWWKEMFEYYGAADYPQIVQEWLAKQKPAPNV